jgi:hypothetical protein
MVSLNNVTLFSPHPPTCLANHFRLTFYLLFPSFNQVRLLRFWSPRLPSAITASGSHSSYSDSDMQIGKRISWPLNCPRAVSSVFWRHHLMARSGRQRDYCCLVSLIFNWIFCQGVGKGGPLPREYNVMFYDARYDHSNFTWWRTYIYYYYYYYYYYYSQNCTV